MKPSSFFALVSLFVVGACRGREHVVVQSGQTTSISGRLLDSIVHLASGDSLEFQAVGPLSLDNGQRGLIVSFHPFAPLADTVHDRELSIALFRTMAGELRKSPPPFVALRAVDQPAPVRNGIGLYNLQSFTVVVEQRADGKWYPYGALEPISIP